MYPLVSELKTREELRTSAGSPSTASPAGGSQRSSPMLVAALCIWTAAVLITTVFSRDPGGTYALSLVPLHSYLEILNGGSSL